MSYPALRRQALALLLAISLRAATPTCPAGMPLGGLELTVKRAADASPLPLAKLNQLEEGDEILYAPSLRPNEKRRGDVTVVLVAAAPSADEKHHFTILDSKDADKPARWTAPFRASLAVYVYGPSGLSMRKLRGFLSKDHELISQLADYAEKTAQTEAVLQALTQYENTGRSENVGAALQGFAGHYGVNHKIDRNAPLNEQTMAAFRTLNPALSAYDPISPSGAQRMSQTAGLAATVAAMFLGSTVGLAAGSTAMALNMKTLLFPDTDFRSAYSHNPKADAMALCTTREPNQRRKRLAYLWAIRLPDSKAPALRIEGPNHLPAGLKTIVKLQPDDLKWRLVSRVRNWRLESEDGEIPVAVTPLADQGGLEINLLNHRTPPGQYRLAGLWDWERFGTEGELFIDELGRFENVRLTPDSQNRLRHRSGKQIVTLRGADFQFVEKAAIVRSGDKYATPQPAPFTLPRGQRLGHQPELELQVDTSGLEPGAYSLLLFQQDGRPQSVDVRILDDPPRIEHLPLRANEGESESRVVLRGEKLDRITALSADGMQLELEDFDPRTSTRAVRIRPQAPGRKSRDFDLRMSVRDYAEPILLANALVLAGPRPRIREAKPSLPSGLQIELREGELPAGVHIGILMRVSGASPEPSLELGCKHSSGSRIRVQTGSERERVKLQSMQADTLFLSLDPGAWPSGCLLTATIHDKTGMSDPVDLGRVTRLPEIESFRLTDETAGEGQYAGVLTGRDLELIEKAGWTADSGIAVPGLPVPLVGQGNKQSLRVLLSWPSPTPHSPLFVWFRGEPEGRATSVRY